MIKLFSTNKLSLSRFLDISKPINDISRTAVSVFDDESISAAINLMLKGTRRVPVVTRDHHVKGIITTTDILDLLGAGDKYDLFLKHRRSLNTHVSKFMDTHVRILESKTASREVLENFKNDSSGTYLVVDKKKLVGIVSRWDFMKSVNRPIGLKVSDIMVKKPFVAKGKYNLFDVSRMMIRGGFRRLPVIDDNIIIGVITPFDIIKYLHFTSKLDKLHLEKTHVKDVMNKNVVTIAPDEDVYKAVELMKKNRIGCVFVAEENNLMGIVTKRDILEVLS